MRALKLAFENRNPVVNVNIMRDRAAMLGVTPLAVQRALANAYSEQQAIDEITANSGVRYDPSVVEAFLSVRVDL